MSKQDLSNDIDTVLHYFQNSTDDMDSTIYRKYHKLKSNLQVGNLKANIIKGSVRAYLDAHSDWDNLILNTMGDLENRIETLVNKDQ